MAQERRLTLRRCPLKAGQYIGVAFGLASNLCPVPRLGHQAVRVRNRDARRQRGVDHLKQAARIGAAVQNRIDQLVRSRDPGRVRLNQAKER